MAGHDVADSRLERSQRWTPPIWRLTVGFRVTCSRHSCRLAVQLKKETRLMIKKKPIMGPESFEKCVQHLGLLGTRSEWPVFKDLSAIPRWITSWRKAAALLQKGLAAMHGFALQWSHGRMPHPVSLSYYKVCCCPSGRTPQLLAQHPFTSFPRHWLVSTEPCLSCRVWPWSWASWLPLLQPRRFVRTLIGSLCIHAHCHSDPLLGIIQRWTDQRGPTEQILAEDWDMKIGTR